LSLAEIANREITETIKNIGTKGRGKKLPLTALWKIRKAYSDPPSPCVASERLKKRQRRLREVKETERKERQREKRKLGTEAANYRTERLQKARPYRTNVREGSKMDERERRKIEFDRQYSYGARDNLLRSRRETPRTHAGDQR
jgi:hypothetical protein